MQQGQFFLYCVKNAGLLGNLLAKFRPADDQDAVNDRVDAFAKRYSEGYGHVEPDTASDVSVPAEFGGNKRQVERYIVDGGGLAVAPGLRQINDCLFRATPYVMHTKDYLIAFTGALANLPDLVEVGQHLERASPAVRQRSASAGSAGSSTDSGSQTTAVLADLCDKHGIDEEGGLLLLSELQGQYAFVVYSTKLKQAFAARDASGSEPLFYRLHGDGSISFTSSISHIPQQEEEQASSWSALPPGHCIAGKSPHVLQFALTYSQLNLREREAEDLMAQTSAPEPIDEQPASFLESISRRLSREPSTKLQAV